MPEFTNKLKVAGPNVFRVSLFARGSAVDDGFRDADARSGDGRRDGHLVAWLKEPGEQVKRGEPLLEVETDKAILPVESPVFGVLSEITALIGSEVATGQMIARLTVAEETTASPSSSIAAPQNVVEASAPAEKRAREEQQARQRSATGLACPCSSAIARLALGAPSPATDPILLQR